MTDIQIDIVKRDIQIDVVKRDIDVAVTVLGASPNAADKNYIQAFTNQTNVTVTHNLNKKPAVSVVDSAGDEVVGDIRHLSNNELQITFSASFTGTVLCN